MDSIPQQLNSPLLSYILDEKIRNSLYYTLSMRNIEFSQKVAYVSIVTKSELENISESSDDIILRNTISSTINQQLYESTIFSLDPVQYKYKGQVLLNSLSISIKNPVIHSGVSEGQINLKLLSVESFTLIEELMKLNNEFFISCGWEESLSLGDISYINNIKNGLGFDWYCVTSNHEISMKEDGSWDIVIDFTCTAFNPLFRFEPRFFGSPDYSSLDYELYMKKDQPFNYMQYDIEDDYFVNLVDLFKRIEDTINSNFVTSDIKPPLTFEKIIEFEFLRLSKVNDNFVLLGTDDIVEGDASKLNLPQNYILTEEVIDTSSPIQIGDVPRSNATTIQRTNIKVKEIPPPGEKIEVSFWTDIEVPIRFTMTQWQTSMNLDEFIKNIISYVENRYTINNYTLTTSGKGNRISFVNIPKDIIQEIINNDSLLLKIKIDNKNSIIGGANFSATNPLDKSYVVASGQINFLGEDMVLIDLRSILDNIDLFGDNNLFIPTGFDDKTNEEIKKQIQDYKNNKTEENKNKLLDESNKFIFFKIMRNFGNSDFFLNKKDGNILIEQQERIQNLIKQGKANANLFYRPLSGDIDVVGNSCYLPLMMFKLIFSSVVPYYTGKYGIEEVTHTFEDNSWMTNLKFSKNLLTGNDLYRPNVESDQNDTEYYDPNIENEEVDEQVKFIGKF